MQAGDVLRLGGRKLVLPGHCYAEPQWDSFAQGYQLWGWVMGRRRNSSQLTAVIDLFLRQSSVLSLNEHCATVVKTEKKQSNKIKVQIRIKSPP